MSYERSGLPGIWTAVRHLVSVLLGAPGPVQAANAAPDVASEAAPISAQVEESLGSMLVTPLSGKCDVLRGRVQPYACAHCWVLDFPPVLFFGLARARYSGSLSAPLRHSLPFFINRPTSLINVRRGRKKTRGWRRGLVFEATND